MTDLREADAAVIRRVTASFREGDEAIGLAPYETELSTGRSVPIDTMVAVLDEAIARFPGAKAASDAWLGPRLHATLRLTRAEAAIPGVWTWLGVGVGANYIRWRWAPKRDTSRFVGASYLQGIARLWWMAELFRNGSDYAPAVAALKNGDIAQNFLRMDIAHHRPTCQGFMLIPSRRRPGESLTGREANALAKAANCAATTFVYEALAPDVALDADARRQWIQGEPDFADVVADTLIAGPDDPEVPPASVAAMTDILTTVFADAPIRNEPTPDPGAEDEEEGEEDDGADSMDVA